MNRLKEYETKRERYLSRMRASGAMKMVANRKR